MVKPTFLCIGVQKAGTTSLIKYLSKHPNIFMKPEESHFFSGYKLNEENIRNYESTFNTNKPIVGEKTPCYNYLQYAIDKIHKYNPNIKLVLILREPISRSFSQYNMTLINSSKKTLTDVTDQEIMVDFTKEEHIKLSEIQSNGNYFINRGKYDVIISYILSKFPRKNLYIGISEEIKKDKQKYYNEIAKFLGARTTLIVNKNLDTHMKEYARPIPRCLEDKLYAIYKEHNERLYNILGRRIDIWEKYYDGIKRIGFYAEGLIKTNVPPAL